ncbi:MAG: zinc-ribbon domain-containing protein, partial [Deltaproteobacteria bacterium]|nr:zinc-ribbon domain-containing protein [Deltaproteobacteria bacterium]
KVEKIKAQCPHCGHEILPGSIFCNNCGEKIT